MYNETVWKILSGRDDFQINLTVVHNSAVASRPSRGLCDPCSKKLTDIDRNCRLRPVKMPSTLPDGACRRSLAQFRGALERKRSGQKILSWNIISVSWDMDYSILKIVFEHLAWQNVNSQLNQWHLQCRGYLVAYEAVQKELQHKVLILPWSRRIILPYSKKLWYHFKDKIFILFHKLTEFPICSYVSSGLRTTALRAECWVSWWSLCPVGWLAESECCISEAPVSILT